MIGIQSIASLLLLLFIAQIFAQSQIQQDSDKHKVLTLTFKNLEKQVTVTLSNDLKAIPTGIDELNEFDDQNSREFIEEEIRNQYDNNLSQDNYKNDNEKLQDNNNQQNILENLQEPDQSKSQEFSKKEENNKQQESFIDPNFIFDNPYDIIGTDEHHYEESMPYPDDYMGYEIDQILEENIPTKAPKKKEKEEVQPIPSSTEEVQAAENKESTVPRVPLAQITSCAAQGQIALTYSEGPSDVTAKIVRQLTKAEARGNFFVNATWLYTQQYAMVVQNIYNAGHFIGMTYRIPNDDPDSMTDDQIRQDIVNNAHTIESLINVSPKYVRLHYTEVKDTRTEGIIQSLGFIIVGYNLDSLDYFKKDATGPNSIQQVYLDTFVKFKDTYDAKGSFISIQYDLPYTGSLAAIPHIINTIDQEGYTMVRLDGCLNDATPYKKSANSSEYIHDQFSLGQPKYHQGQKSIVVETKEEAAEADELFQIQGIVSNIATMQQISLSVLFMTIGSIFILLL